MMVAKFWVAALAAGVIGAAALSAPSAYAQSAAQPAAKPAAKAPATGAKTAPHHKMGCYDYAWQSQQMQDCLAKSSGKKPAAQKTSTTTKKTSTTTKKPASKTKGKQQS